MNQDLFMIFGLFWALADQARSSLSDHYPILLINFDTLARHLLENVHTGPPLKKV
jgi:hypothetical protein